MDENTKAFIEVGKKLHKDNEATLAELKKISKPSTLQQSTQENAGEILSNLLVGALDRKAEAQVAKGTNLGVGVSAKNGVDIVPGGEPSVDEKDTLFGITKAFYDKYNFGNLINSTKEVTKNVAGVKKAYDVGQVRSLYGVKLTQKIFQKILDFFKKSDSSSGAASKKKKSKAVKEESLLKRLANFLDPSGQKRGIRAGFEGGTGITKLRTTLSDKLNGMLKSFKGFPMMIGGVLAIPFRLIGKGLYKLGATLLKPLGSIVKGIASLPGKILGFFGGVIGMIGRLALLGGGIFALSKLTEYLKGVGPGGQKSFVETLMFAFDKLVLVFGLLKDTITETVIPIMISLGEAIYKVLEFLSRFVPGIHMGQGNAAKAEQKIRAKYEGDVEDPSYDLPGDAPLLTKEQKEVLIQKEMARDRIKRREEAIKAEISRRMYLDKPFINYDKKLKAEVSKYAGERFDAREGIGLTIGNVKVIGGANSEFSKIQAEYIKAMNDLKIKYPNATVVSQNNQANNNVTNITGTNVKHIGKDTNNATGG